MTQPVLGTAHLFTTAAAGPSRAILEAAAGAGFRRVDTAPSYGHGDGEVEVAELVREPRWGGRAAWFVTTKTGIEPVARPGAVTRGVKSLARRMPGPVQQRLRGDRPPGGGSFEPSAVRASVRRSVQRLGHLDRLLLHEARAEDLTDDLLAELQRLLESADVAAIGLATGAQDVDACLARAPELFTVVQLAVGLRAARPRSIPRGTVVVGHGAFGAAGRDLAELWERVRAADGWGRAWAAATVGTRWQGRDGLADALLVRVASGTSRVDELIVASSSVQRLAHGRELLTEDPELPAALGALLDDAATG